MSDINNLKKIKNLGLDNSKDSYINRSHVREGKKEFKLPKI